MLLRIYLKNRKPTKLQKDKGKDFIIKSFQVLFKSNKILWLSSKSEQKAQTIEGFNRTIKEKLWKYFINSNTKRWLDVLTSFVGNYNNSHHRCIKIKSIEDSKKEN